MNTLKTRADAMPRTKPLQIAFDARSIQSYLNTLRFVLSNARAKTLYVTYSGSRGPNGYHPGGPHSNGSRLRKQQDITAHNQSARVSD